MALAGVLYASQLHAEDASDLYRKEPQRKYEGAVSFFFVHGSATAFYQDFEEDFSSLEDNGQPLLGVNPRTNQPGGAGLIGRPGNITMANSGGDGTFHHDVGLIIGAEINS